MVLSTKKYELLIYKVVLICECQRLLYRTPRHLLETCCGVLSVSLLQRQPTPLERFVGPEKDRFC